MCFRLLAAVKGPLSDEGVAHLALRHGLDVRSAEKGGVRFVEIAWGDCACSLYTRREGRERAVGFVADLLAQGAEVQLLLFSDGDEVDWTSGAPERVDLAAFQARGLQALPERRVALLA